MDKKTLKRMYQQVRIMKSIMPHQERWFHKYVDAMGETPMETMRVVTPDTIDDKRMLKFLRQARGIEKFGWDDAERYAKARAIMLHTYRELRKPIGTHYSPERARNVCKHFVPRIQFKLSTLGQ